MNMKNQFRQFLITEERVYLGQKVGDILTALQQLNGDAANMGKRHLMRLMKNIVRQIRRILRSSWTFEEQQYLKVLQKVAVALMKGLDTNEDLPSLVSSAASEMESLSDKMEEPINNLAGPAVNRDNTEEDD
jgi:hypothetical protein